MRDLSEYKLLGYYLIKFYEKNYITQIKYEQVKYLTQCIFKRLGSYNNYHLLPIEEKMNIVKSMINKGVFNTKVINGKPTFSQKYNYEIIKYINTTYSYDGSLAFKLPKEIHEGNNNLFNLAKHMYTDGIDLGLQAAINAEINNFYSKQLKKIL